MGFHHWDRKIADFEIGWTGVAAGFNAPISGVFFAVESVLQREPRDSETEARNSSGLTVAMVLLASVLAAIVSRAGLGDNPAFRVPPYQLQSLWEIPLVMILGSACGLVSVGFSYCSEVNMPWPFLVWASPPSGNTVLLLSLDTWSTHCLLSKIF